MNITEYINGGIACRNGKPCPDESHPDFVAGYSAQYELEQVNTEMSLRSAQQRSNEHNEVKNHECQ